MFEELASLDVGRLVFVLIIFVAYFGISFFTKKWLLTSVAFLLFLLPFNITLQLTNFSFISEEYIRGIVSSYTIPTIHLLDIFVLFSFIIILKQKLILNLFKSERVFFIVLLLLFSTKAFIDWDLLSTLTIYRLFFYILTIYVVAKYFLLQYRFTLKEKQFLIYLLVFSVFIQFGIGITQFLQGSSIGLSFLGESQVVKGMYGSSFVELQNSLFLRAYGTFPHPNILAGYLFFLMSFSLLFLKGYTRIIIVGLSLALIFLTFSRIIILLLLGLFLLFAVKYFLEKTKGFSFMPLFIDRFLNFEHSFSDRIDLVKNAFEIIKQYPMWGIGVSRYVYGIEYYPIYTAGGFLLLEPVHNVYILLLTEYGLVFGLPLISGVLYFLLRIFFRGNMFFKYFVFSIFVISMLDHYFITLPQGIFIFFMVVSLLYLYTLRCKDFLIEEV